MSNTANPNDRHDNVMSIDAINDHLNQLAIRELSAPTTAPTIREIARALYVDNTIADYNQMADYMRLDLHDGTWVAVGPDVDPEHPELDADAAGYIWTAYEKGGDAYDCGGDSDITTLAAAIRTIAGR